MFVLGSTSFDVEYERSRELLMHLEPATVVLLIRSIEFTTTTTEKLYQSLEREREEAIDREKSIINAPIFLLQPPMHESDQVYLSIESYPTEMEVLGFATNK